MGTQNEVREMNNSLKEQVIKSSSELFSTSSCKLHSFKEGCLHYSVQLPPTPKLNKNILATIKLIKKLVSLELLSCCFTPEHTLAGADTLTAKKLVGSK